MHKSWSTLIALFCLTLKTELKMFMKIALRHLSNRWKIRRNEMDTPEHTIRINNKPMMEKWKYISMVKISHKFSLPHFPFRKMNTASEITNNFNSNSLSQSHRIELTRRERTKISALEIHIGHCTRNTFMEWPKSH